MIDLDKALIEEKKANHVVTVDSSILDATTEGIMENCSSFYYVFCKLEENTKIPHGDETAMKKFIEKKKNEKILDIPNLKVAEVVNGAMAFELALKYLYCIETAQYIRGHNLLDLFDKLTVTDKKEILNNILIKTHHDENTFRHNLKLLSNSFHDWRYCFEKEYVSVAGSFNNFIHIVYAYAKSKNSSKTIK